VAAPHPSNPLRGKAGETLSLSRDTGNTAWGLWMHGSHEKGKKPLRGCKPAFFPPNPLLFFRNVKLLPVPL
jgi:hypothetical protein